MALSLMSPDVMAKYIKQFEEDQTHTFLAAYGNGLYRRYDGAPGKADKIVFKIIPQPRGATDADFWRRRRERLNRVATFTNWRTTYEIAD